MRPHFGSCMPFEDHEPAASFWHEFFLARTWQGP